MLSWRSLITVLLTGQLGGAEPLPDKVEFNRDIRPILSNNCFLCHGPDKGRRKGGLRLDLEAEAKKEVLVPGKIQESELWARITSIDPDERMPPAKAKKDLKPRQIALIKKWIEQGAKYEGHWAFNPPKQPTLPKVKTQWGINPIDRFILAKLEAEGLKPSPEAAKEILVRRVTFDLTGLPPTLAEVDAFINDKSPNAYEKVVDRLLASKAYAERMTLHWMDVARYGDSSVHHADGPRTMWPWRDWVINAYDTNKSFKEFTTEQLAGDLIPNATVDQKVATGFNRNHGTTDEGGLIVEEYRVEYVVDRVKTTGNVFLGLSVECAQCHSHKYDPISQKEYYKFFAFFNNNADSGKQTRGGNAPPMVNVISKHDLAKQNAAQAKLKAVENKLSERRKNSTADFTKWTTEAAKTVDEPAKEPSGLFAHITLDEFKDRKTTDSENKGNEAKWEGNGKTVSGKFGGAFRVEGNGFVNVKGIKPPEWNQEFSYGCWVKPDAGNANGALFSKMNEGNAYRGFDLWLQQGAPGAHIINKWQDNAVKVVGKEKVKAKQWSHVFVTYDGKGKAAGTKVYINGKLVAHNVEADGLNGTIQTPRDFRIGRRFNSAQANNIEIDDVRLYNRALTPSEVAALAGNNPIAPILAIAPGKRDKKQNATLFNHYLNNIDEEYQKLTAEKRGAEAELASIGKTKITSMVMGDRSQMRPTYLLERGHYEHPDKEETIQPGVPDFLPPMPKDAPSNRLGLAQWLTLPNHPLTARVAVNRYWSLLFGRGIVKSVSDFGTQGEWPSHPALLDWLALDFVRNNWNIKGSIKQIVMSATYRQSSRLTRELYLKDPGNVLLARGPRFRLQGEFVRDNALAVSGLLVDKVGGASVKPYQPPGLWNEVSLSGNVRFRQDTGEGLYRKSMYTYWKRSAPAPSMTIFDAPTREKCMVERPRTNTPLQALVTMNDPQFVEAARHLAERIMTEGGKTIQSRVQFGYRTVTARAPKPLAGKILASAFREELENFKKDPNKAKALLGVGDSKRNETLDAAEHAAWTIVASMLLNLDEVITRL
ncbi:MAG: hypothetical protein CMO74_05210 [Verrucomicrobiales bacterium]|nr:hypothetical protein [Verrucomicrobiales bacterium]|tara:strand:+ start:49905 stop:53051 length:3147 start_codon:yes stop_codon:yes gene_type:complete